MLFWLLLRVAVRLTVLNFPGNGWVGFGYRLKWHEDRVLLYGWAAFVLSNFVSGYEMWDVAFQECNHRFVFLLFRHSFVAFRGFVALLSSSHSSSLWHCQEFYVFPLSIFQGFCQHFWLVETSIWFKTLTKCCCSSSCFKKRHSGRHFDKLNWNFVCLVEQSRKYLGSSFTWS